MCDLVVAMMSEGASKAEVAAACGISRETLYAWCDPQHRHHRKAFAQAVTYGELLAEAWWQRLGRMAVLGAVPGFVPAAYIWQTKNRFGWRDRVDIGQDQPLQVAVVDYAAAPSAGETE